MEKEKTRIKHLQSWTGKFFLVLALGLYPVAGVYGLQIDEDDDEGPDPAQVRIRSIVYAGSGCKAGTVSENLAEDAKAFTLLFDSYIASAGPGVPITETRKNCTINLDLQFPQGWSYTLFQVDYRGYASLDLGSYGEQKSSYYFQGQALTGALKSRYRAPMSDDYHIRDTLGLSALVWSPCGISRSLNVNTQVRVSAVGTAQALMTVDSIDGQLKHRYGIQWRRCS